MAAAAHAAAAAASDGMGPPSSPVAFNPITPYNYSSSPTAPCQHTCTPNLIAQAGIENNLAARAGDVGSPQCSTPCAPCTEWPAFSATIGEAAASPTGSNRAWHSPTANNSATAAWMAATPATAQQDAASWQYQSQQDTIPNASELAAGMPAQLHSMHNEFIMQHQLVLPALAGHCQDQHHHHNPAAGLPAQWCDMQNELMMQQQLLLSAMAAQDQQQWHNPAQNDRMQTAVQQHAMTAMYQNNYMLYASQQLSTCSQSFSPMVPVPAVAEGLIPAAATGISGSAEPAFAATERQQQQATGEEALEQYGCSGFAIADEVQQGLYTRRKKKVHSYQQLLRRSLRSPKSRSRMPASVRRQSPDAACNRGSDGDIEQKHRLARCSRPLFRALSDSSTTAGGSSTKTAATTAAAAAVSSAPGLGPSQLSQADIKLEFLTAKRLSFDNDAAEWDRKVGNPLPWSNSSSLLSSANPSSLQPGYVAADMEENSLAGGTRRAAACTQGRVDRCSDADVNMLVERADLYLHDWKVQAAVTCLAGTTDTCQETPDMYYEDRCALLPASQSKIWNVPAALQLMSLLRPLAASSALPSAHAVQISNAATCHSCNSWSSRFMPLLISCYYH